MKITTNNIDSLPEKSAAAVVTMLLANTLCVGEAVQDYHPLVQADASAFVAQCLRVSSGPIALILIHGADEWAGVLAGHGLTVSRSSYVFDTLDLVIGAAGPISDMPSSDIIGLRELVEATTRAVSVAGDAVLVPFAGIPAPAMAVQAAGRNAHVIAITSAHADQIRCEYEGQAFTEPLDDETYAAVIAKLNAGKSVSAVSRSLGVAISRLNRRLLNDGYRTQVIRRPRKNREAAAEEQACVEGTKVSAGV